MKKAWLIIGAIQVLQFTVAIVMLALNRHESFQDWLLFTLALGYMAGFDYKEK